MRAADACWSRCRHVCSHTQAQALPTVRCSPAHPPAASAAPPLPPRPFLCRRAAATACCCLTSSSSNNLSAAAALPSSRWHMASAKDTSSPVCRGGRDARQSGLGGAREGAASNQRPHWGRTTPPSSASPAAHGPALRCSAPHHPHLLHSAKQLLRGAHQQRAPLCKARHQVRQGGALHRGEACGGE